ncbi:hypothetical protein [Hydrogenobacter thermophilus]|uniref:hypothetical protein n=1 Tax=Hydrogenobacter thermophilus TaxID=940 RepID=UPI0030FB43E2
MRKPFMVTLLPLFFLFSCAKHVEAVKTIEVPVITKCEVPEVPQAELEKITKGDSYEERLRKLISNYGKLKEENFLLRQAIEVCR